MAHITHMARGMEDAMARSPPRRAAPLATLPGGEGVEAAAKELVSELSAELEEAREAVAEAQALQNECNEIEDKIFG